MKKGMRCGDFVYRQAGSSGIEIIRYLGNDRLLCIPRRIGSQTVISIGPGAFRNCSNLVIVEIPKNVTAVHENAFAGCLNLVAAKVPPSLKIIKPGAFSKSTFLVSSIEGAFRTLQRVTGSTYVLY